jgi:predicted dehydrogenase
VPSLTDHAELLQVVEDSGLSLQVGFQARGGGGVARMWELLTSGVLGEVRSVDAYGAWLRDRAYYQRSSWAGKRVLDGKRVADGVGTNPLAHAIDVALVIAGITQSEQVAGVTRELRHAHPIEADDTASIRIDPVDDDLPFVQAALTTTAPKQSDPWVRLRGTAGTATLFYTADRIELEVAGERTVETFDRESLVENLLDHLTDPGTPLISPLGSTGAFMTVLEATQTDPDPSPIGPEHVTWVGEGLELHPVVQDVEAWMSRALDEGRTFTEVGAPWGDPDAVVRWRAGRAG